MASYTIEDIELLRKKSGMTYQEAVALIDYHDGNMYYDGRRKLLEKHTHKNALFACESESAMGGGERGGL